MKKNIIKRHCEYFAMSAAIKILRILPYSWAEPILTGLFIFIGMVFGIRKKTALRQLKSTFPEKTLKQHKAILRNTYDHYARLAADLFLKDSDQDKVIDIEGWENITESLKSGNGLIVVSGHIGNWELAGRYISSQGIPINVVIKKIKNPYVNEHINNIRTKNGINIIYKKKALKPTLKALKNNEILVTLIDQNAGREGIKHPFLGKDASLFTGFVRLAFKYDTPLVFGVAFRNEDASYRFVFERPVIPSEFRDEHQLTDRNALEIEIAKHFHKRLEYYVNRCPEQWFWLHNRWKGAHKAKISK